MKRTLLALAVLLGLVLPVNAQCTGNAGAGRVCGNETASSAPAGWKTQTSMFDRAFCSTNNSALARISGTWVCLASANNGVWVTSAGGVPSISSTLPSGLTVPSPTLTGTPVAPTAAVGTNTTQIATTAFVASAVPVKSIISCGAVADGSTDNTTAIQSCFDNNVAVLIPASSLAFCSRALTIPTTLKQIQIQGELKACGSLTAFAAFLRGVNSSGLTISGFGTINVNSTTYSTNGVINIVTGTDVTVSGVNINHGGRFPIQIETCTDCTINGVIADNYTQTAIESSLCGGCKFTDNRLTATAGVAGPVTININVAGGNDVITARNYIYGGSLWAVHYGDVLRGSITDNNIQDTGAEGITVGGASSYTQVLNNEVSFGASVGVDFGMSQQGTDASNQVKYTLWQGNTVANSYSSGIHIASDSLHTTAHANMLIDVGRSADATHASGIAIDGPRATYTYVKSNTVVSTTGTNTTNCVKEVSGAADLTFVDGNTCRGMSTTNIVLAGTNSKTITQHDTTAGIPNGNLGINGLLANNLAALGTPAAGKTHVWTDSTSKRLRDKDDAGVIGTTVIADAGASNNFLTAISTAGVISKAQPSVSNLSGFGTGIATALGINVGSAGAPVLLNGALGSPSSVGTMPAFTVSAPITSTVSTGTAPFVIASTTQVTNLNAAQAGTSTNANITDDTTTNATMFPTWVTTGTGGMPIKVTSSKLTFNPSSGLLSATAVAGSLATATGLPLTTGVTGTLPIANGGTGISSGTFLTISNSVSVNFGSAGDNAITIPLASGYTRIGGIQVAISGASGDISAATFGVFTATGGGGAAVYPAGTAITVTTSAANTLNNMQVVNQPSINALSVTPVANTLYFRVGATAAQTANVQISYRMMP